MPTFEITTPDGKAYHVEGDNAEGAVNALHQSLGGTPPVVAPPVVAPARGTRLNIEGRKVSVDDSFLKLSSNDQHLTVDDIAKSLGSAPPARSPVTDPTLLAKLNGDSDPIHIGAPDGSIVQFPAGTSDDTINAAMRKEYGGPKAAPAAAEPKSLLTTIREAVHAPTRALENGAFLGLGDRARAVVDSGVEALSGKGFNYGDNLRKEQGDTEQFAKDHPIASPVLEGVGGVIAPLAVVKAAASGASLGAKTLIGAGTGGTLGAVQGVLGSKDWTDGTQVAKDAAFGGAAGGAFGIMLPGASKIVGAGFEKLANAVTGKVDGMSRAAGAHLIRGVEADGPGSVQARLQELGPDAMLADAGPALLGKAQGASLNSDEGRSILQTALTNRNVGTNARVQGDVNRALGPAEDPQTVTDAIRAHRTAVDSVNYPAALNNAPAMKIAPISRT
jgi:hypothetical protein